MEQGLSRSKAYLYLGLPYKEVSISRPEKITEASLRDVAVETLGELLYTMRENPSSYKTSEVLAVVKEVLTLNGGKSSEDSAINVLPSIRIGGVVASYDVGGIIEDAEWMDADG